MEKGREGGGEGREGCLTDAVHDQVAVRPPEDTEAPIPRDRKDNGAPRRLIHKLDTLHVVRVDAHRVCSTAQTGEGVATTGS